MAGQTQRDRGFLLFLLGERREEPPLVTARFFDLAAIHNQGRINFKKQLLTSLKWVLNLRMADLSQNAVRLRDRCQYPLVCCEATFPLQKQNEVEGVVFRRVQEVCLKYFV